MIGYQLPKKGEIFGDKKERPNSARNCDELTRLPKMVGMSVEQKGFSASGYLGEKR